MSDVNRYAKRFEAVASNTTGLFKTEPFVFGVWKVKARRNTTRLDGSDTGIRYWDYELDAWGYLLTRSLADRTFCQKKLDAANRNVAKAMKKLQAG